MRYCGQGDHEVRWHRISRAPKRTRSMRNHAFRSDDGFCVMGRSKTASRKSSKKAEKTQVAIISFKYAAPKNEEGKEEELKMWSILVRVDHECNWITANMVPRKGPEQFALH